MNWRLFVASNINGELNFKSDKIDCKHKSYKKYKRFCSETYGLSVKDIDFKPMCYSDEKGIHAMIVAKENKYLNNEIEDIKEILINEVK